MAPCEKLRVYNLNEPHSASYITRAISSLSPFLPVSLPLYRRLQFGRFLDASVLISNINCAEPERNNQDESSPSQEPWLIAFVDRSCRPETELMMYGSWESGSSPPQTNQDTLRKVSHLLTSLVKEVKGLGVPVSIHQDVLDAAAKAGPKPGEMRLHWGADVMLWGAIHEWTAAALKQLGFVSLKLGFTPNSTFIFDVDRLRAKPLPDGLVWGTVSPQHFALVKSRTSIPRQDRTLAVLPSLAIFEKNSTTPIAWAFVGLDGSLTSLHVEQQWRGRGLAKTLTTTLLRDKMTFFHKNGMARSAHAYVIEGNEQSEGMCSSLGGKTDWNTYWLAIDLNEAIEDI